MFRRKEESFEFESESGNENNAAALMGAARDGPSYKGESAEYKSQSASPGAVPATPSAPRPASLAQAPGAAPRAPATSAAPSAFRPAGTPSAASVASSPAAARPATPLSAPVAPSVSGGAPASPPAHPSPKTSGKRILTVGNDILLKGEIATCDRLVIEGEVDATLNDVHTVEIAEAGSFRGRAEIEDAEISGIFEGDLVVRNRLTIYSTGKVRGKIAYGEIEIERGGELTGEITIVGQAVIKPKDKEKAA